MKRVFIMFAVALFLACNSDASKEEISSQANSNTQVKEPAYVYPVNYGVATIGDIKHTETIVSVWKDFDDGKVLQQKDRFADSAEFHTSDGYGYKGPRDSVLQKGLEYRNSFSSVSSSVNGIISFTLPYKATGKTENWVALWGTRIYADKNGKKDTIWLHEAWRVDSAGKINCLYQFNAKRSPL